MRFFLVLLVRWDANFDSFFALHSHFALFRIFFALFTRFLFNNHETTTKKVEKVRKCEKSAKSAMQMRNAMRWVVTKSASANANAMRKSFRTTIPGRCNGFLISTSFKQVLQLLIPRFTFVSMLQSKSGFEIARNSRTLENNHLHICSPWRFRDSKHAKVEHVFRGKRSTEV
jgi:hypothetical protein